MTRLTGTALDFAKAHIERYYDSDFFPKPMVFEALWAQWDEVKKDLGGTNVEKLQVETPRMMPAPKSTGGYRMVHQLQPLDAIIYTALAHQVSGCVEAARIPTSEETVFSYRVSPTSDSFFGLGNGYPAFQIRCRKLARSYGYVLTADIADFYNSIYSHRLNSALVEAKCQPTGIAKTVEDFITTLNGKASQGIPVGPAASIVMSEALLTDVDGFLRMRRIEHTRYADDIRVFSNDRDALLVLEEELAFYLYDVHRLRLAAGKTEVLPSEVFVCNYLDSDDIHERKELLEAAQAVCSYGDMYTEEDIEDLRERIFAGEAHTVGDVTPWTDILAYYDHQEEIERKMVRGLVLARLLQVGLSKKPLNLGLVRHALRQGRRLRVVELVEPCLARIDELGPALPDVFLYLHAMMNSDVAEGTMDALRALPDCEGARKSRFVRHWLYWFLASLPKCVEDRVLGPAIWERAPLEAQARAAITTRNVAWIRCQRNTLSSLGPWDRWAVLCASVILPSAERGPWLRGWVQRGGVDAWVAKWAIAQA